MLGHTCMLCPPTPICYLGYNVVWIESIHSCSAEAAEVLSASFIFLFFYSIKVVLGDPYVDRIHTCRLYSFKAIKRWPEGPTNSDMDKPLLAG
jgi:hypothetical protein